MAARSSCARSIRSGPRSTSRAWTPSTPGSIAIWHRLSRMALRRSLRCPVGPRRAFPGRCWRFSSADARWTPLSLAVCARNPEHVLRAAVIRHAAGDEEVIGHAVDVTQRGGADFFVQRQFDHQPFGPSGYCAGEMEMGCRRRSARQDEGIERLQGVVHQIDLALEALDLRIDNSEPAFAATAILRGRKVGTEIEQVVLDAAQHLV